MLIKLNNSLTAKHVFIIFFFYFSNSATHLSQSIFKASPFYFLLHYFLKLSIFPISSAIILPSLEHSLAVLQSTLYTEALVII